jgi:tetratricopeptide (TPR) repeat protein
LVIAMTPTNDDTTKPHAASCKTARPHYARALDMLLTHRGDAAAEIDRALAGDPADASDHCLRAAIIVSHDDGAARRKLAASLAAIAAACPPPDDPIRRHAQAAQAWLEGDQARALELYGAIVLDDPHDVLALVVAHALDFRLGNRPMLRHRIGQALAAWDPTMPHYASVLAMHAFGLEENGQYERAEAAAREALALDPRLPGAIHVLAHVLEMQGRYREGLALLAATEPAWVEGTGFSVHLAWHRALFHLDADDPAAALAVYDAHIAPVGDLPALADASSLLWRLMLRNVPTAERWQRLADRWAASDLDGARPFYAMHAMMAFAATGRAGAAARTIAALPDADELVAPEDALARAFCNALLAFARGDYATSIERLGTVRAIADRCGGSVAQCDVVHLTLTEAALRGQHTRLARALVAERKAQKPDSRLNRRLSDRVRSMVSAAA